MSDSLQDALEKLVDEAEHYDTCDLVLSPMTNQFGCSCLLSDLRGLLAAHSVEPAPVASRERVAEVLARQFADEDPQTDFFDACSEVEQRAMVRAMDSFAGALIAAGVFRDEATP